MLKHSVHKPLLYSRALTEASDIAVVIKLLFVETLIQH